MDDWIGFIRWLVYVGWHRDFIAVWCTVSWTNVGWGLFSRCVFVKQTKHIVINASPFLDVVDFDRNI